MRDAVRSLPCRIDEDAESVSKEPSRHVIVDAGKWRVLPELEVVPELRESRVVFGACGVYRGKVVVRIALTGKGGTAMPIWKRSHVAAPGEPGEWGAFDDEAELLAAARHDPHVFGVLYERYY